MAGIADFEKKLRTKGFRHRKTAGFMHKYDIKGIEVDIMPMDEGEGGPINPWYRAGYVNTMEVEVDKDAHVPIFKPPYFLAAKMEAFKGRGKGDGRQSQDFEDIVYILENRSNIWEELQDSDAEVKQYLISEFQKLQNKPNFEDWIHANAEWWGSPPASYLITERLKEFTGVD